MKSRQYEVVEKVIILKMGKYCLLLLFLYYLPLFGIGKIFDFLTLAI